MQSPDVAEVKQAAAVPLPETPAPVEVTEPSAGPLKSEETPSDPRTLEQKNTDGIAGAETEGKFNYNSTEPPFLAIREHKSRGNGRTTKRPDP